MIEPYNAVYECKRGLFCVQKADSAMAVGLREFGECGEYEIELLCGLVKCGDFVVDVGACIGIFSIPLGQKVGATGLVFAIEPERTNYLNLCANASINSVFAVEPMQAVASDSPGTINVGVTDPWRTTNIGLFSPFKHSGPRQLSVITIDSLCPGRRVSLIKIDVEGHEPEVIQGARETIKRDRPYIYAECFTQTALDAQIAAFPPDVEYKAEKITGTLLSETPWKNAENANKYQHVTSTNILYSPIK